MDTSIQEALGIFGIDPQLITEGDIKKRFYALAKEYHPDTKLNYKEKLAATEIFQKLVAAKSTLESAINKGTLPTKIASVTPKDNKSGQKSSPESAPSATKKPTSFDDLLSPRQKYDKAYPTPSERIMGIPLIGSIFGFIMIIVIMFSMTAGFIIIYPFWILAAFMPERLRAKFKKIKFPDLATSIPVFLVLYFLSYFAGEMYFSKDPKFFIIWWIASWSVISVMLADEIYSLARYYIILKLLKPELDACKYVNNT